MKDQDKLKALEELISYSFGIEINMNDTFYYACADSCQIEEEDIFDILPLILKYKFDATLAYEAIKRGHDPQIKKKRY